MKKALIVTTIGGFLPQFELNNVSILQERGVEVHYASNFAVPVYAMDTEELERRGIRLHPLGIEKSPLKVVKNLRAVRRLRQIIQEEKIDLIHCHTPLGGVVARLAARGSRNRPKVIYTAHGFHFYSGAPLLNWLCFYPVERLLARFTDCIITINREDWARSRRFRLKRGGMCKQIPGVGIHLSRFCPCEGKRADLRRQLGIPHDAFHIVSAAELNENKNQSVIIQAIASLPYEDIYYSICGDGPYVERLEQMIRDCGLERRVHLLGFRTDMEKILQSADCFAFPSRREGLGIAALEALACGVPVIAADNRGTREYMIDGVDGIVCFSDDVQAFARAISRLRDDPELCRRMGNAGRTIAVKFSISEADTIMRGVYQEMLE